MQMTRKQKYRRVLLALAALFLILAVLLGYDAMRESLPDTMYVDENSESPFQPLTKHPLLTISEDTKEAEKNEFGETGETVVECSAAGIPLKKIRVIQEERPKVAVCGAPVGIYMETDGVMVIRTAEIRSSDGTVSRPSENILREGDYITKVNGQSIRSKQELIDAVKVSNGSPVSLSLLRDGEMIEVQVTPQKSQDGTCRLGAWVRDNMQGIGTLTFVEPDGTFAALGHGISDVDTGKMLQLNGGELYLTQILSVIPGKAGPVSFAVSDRQPSFSTRSKSPSSPAISYFIFSFSVICSRSIFFCLAIFSTLLFSAFLLYPECRHFFPALYLLLSNGYEQSASLLAHSRRAASQLIFSSLLSKSPPKAGIFYLPPRKNLAF